MAKILICDDEPGLRAVIKRYAQFEGHEAAEAVNGMEAVEACKRDDYDIVIMDIMMPELDGFSTVREIRKTSDVPILMLSARGEEYDKILGFELGIDDYVVKPFSSKEIMMRIAAILRRANKTSNGTGGNNSDKGGIGGGGISGGGIYGGSIGAGGIGIGSEDGHVIFEKGGLTVDMTAYKVFIDGKQIDLAPKLYDLLFFLIRNKNIAVPREKILTDVWGYDYFGDDRTLDTHMKLLRKAIGPYADYIKTLRGLGYRFEG